MRRTDAFKLTETVTLICSWYGLNACLHPKMQVEVLTPITSECKHTWRQDLYKGKSGKMKSLRWALIYYDLDTGTQGGEVI